MGDSWRHLGAWVQRLLGPRDGQATIEYGLILFIVAIASLAALMFFGHDVASSLHGSGNTMQHLP